ncbi:MAG: prolyl oligopeptidase family serine peptidase [Armatimonadetes bacterium]|nr:prolyl oligopeptidase family serine peptidase [Armatimonadota bacterium]
MSLEGTNPQLKVGDKILSTLRLSNFPTGYRLSATPAPKLLEAGIEFSIVKPGISDLPKIFNPQDAGYLGTERTFRCVWFPAENRFEQVENGTWLNAQIGSTGKWAIVENPMDPTLAFPGFRFPREQWLLNIGTGDLRILARDSTEPAVLNEKRASAVIKTATGWNWIDLNQGTVTAIPSAIGTGDSPTKFVGDKAICFAGGKVVTIEKGIAKAALGTKSGLKFSYRASSATGIYLAAEETATGKIGIAVLSNGAVKTQIESATLSGLKTYGGKVTYLRQSFEDSPNVMIANSDFSNPELLTDTNPQQDEFFWGKAIPVPGATLITPANPGEGKSPLVVTVYERMAGRGYEYSTPKADSAYSIQGWSQDGYYVLLPDITYEPNKPGESAKKSVEAILMNLKKQYSDKIDFDRVAVVGHSWGGYEAVMLAATSKMFRCAIAGAPITDLISLQGQEYEIGKVPHSTVLEYGQGYLTGPFWDYVKDHQANSPIFNLKTLETPILVAYGGKDQMVPPSQSQELFHAMRRLSKKGVFLEYADDDHSLSNPATRKDYSKKVREWLARYLKGETPMPWMVANR